MKKIFLTSGLVLCMACPAFAGNPTGGSATTDIAANAATGSCVIGTLGTADEGKTTTFTAKWTPDGYTITYAAGTTGLAASRDVSYVTGGTPDATNVNFSMTNIALATNNFAATGYHFGGWVSAKELETNTATSTTYAGAQSSTPNGDYAGGSLSVYRVPDNSTVYTSWIANTYTVSYNATTHSATPSAGTSNTATFDATYAEPDDIDDVKAAATGYTFVGWTTDSTPVVTRDTGTGAVNTGTVANAWSASNNSPWTTDAGATVYAAYIANQHTISYNCGQSDNGAAATGTIADAVVTFDETNGYTLPAANSCTLEGYTFRGWNCPNLTGTKTVADRSNNANALFAASATGTLTYDDDITCTAIWTPNNMGIAYTGDGSWTGGATACTYDTTFNLPTNPTRTGYTFAGWEATSVTTPVQGN